MKCEYVAGIRGRKRKTSSVLSWIFDLSLPKIIKVAFRGAELKIIIIGLMSYGVFYAYVYVAGVL